MGKQLINRSCVSILLFIFCLAAVPAFSEEVPPQGTVVTVAGSTDEPGFSGDEGPAVRAQLSLPTGVAVDAAGSIFIADTVNHRIRKVSADGIIRTLAGIGPDGIRVNGQIGDYGTFSGDGGPAVWAGLHFPQDVVPDATGNVWFSDSNNGRIRRITPDGVISSEVGSNRTENVDNRRAKGAPIGLSQGLAFDARGNLYIYSGNGRIYQVDTNGYLRTYVVASPYSVRPGSVAVDTEGTLYYTIADNVRKVMRDGNSRTVVTGLKGPQSVAVDAVGNLFIANTWGNTVLKILPDGRTTPVAGTGERGYSGDGGPALKATFNTVTVLAIDADGNLLIADLSNHRIRKVFGVAAPGLFAGVPFPGSGDVKRDGRIDIGDVLLALRAALANIPLSPEERAFADVNGDQQVNMKDVVLILQKAIRTS